MRWTRTGCYLALVCMNSVYKTQADSESQKTYERIVSAVY